MRALLASLLFFSACGGFDNTPLRLGEVRGQLLGADPSRAFVSVVGAPDTVASVDEAGVFALGGVEPGPRELLAVGRDDQASRLSVLVEAGRVAELGEVALAPAGVLEIYARAPGRQKVGRAIGAVEGTPWRGLFFAGEDEVYVRGVPRGCWTAVVEVPGLGAASQEACLGEGELRKVDVVLPEPDGSPGREGCSVTGCEEGFSCQSDGACR